jgi:cold shock CspA family protein
MEMRGIVDRIAPEAGFGFVTASGEEFFFHASGLSGTEFGELAPGLEVEFEVVDRAEGDAPEEHRRAVNVHLVADEAPAVDHERLPDQKIA